MGQGQSVTLRHYTTEAGFKAIMMGGEDINPSQVGVLRQNAAFGDGVYATKLHVGSFLRSDFTATAQIEVLMNNYSMSRQDAEAEVRKGPASRAAYFFEFSIPVKFCRQKSTYDPRRPISGNNRDVWLIQPEMQVQALNLLKTTDTTVGSYLTRKAASIYNWRSIESHSIVGRVSHAIQQLMRKLLVAISTWVWSKCAPFDTQLAYYEEMYNELRAARQKLGEQVKQLRGKASTNKLVVDDLQVMLRKASDECSALFAKISEIKEAMRN
ncbi:MAG: hypothetical protein COA68_12435 [Oceanobacter sp.]|nr:MAG: hypothetical protein COA68_12435 [Oceanobacter sp.]